MPVDVEARVIFNTRLSPDYNVIALAAPTIAASVAPGQFVMVKPGRAHDPLLRRPFSVFEILRDDADGNVGAGFSRHMSGPAKAGPHTNGPIVGLTLLSKRIGVTTNMLFDAVEGLSLIHI